jgi:acyl carrier protein
MKESEIDERFLNFNPETVAAIRIYRQTRDPKLVHEIVHGIIEKYLPPELRNQTSGAVTSLNAFGIESVTLMEIILDIQDALDLVITDEELRNLRGFDDATKLLSDKVAALGAAPTGPS